MPVIEIESYDQFYDIIMNEGETKHNYEHVIVDFYGKNCPPCTVFAPTFDELSEIYENEPVCFLKINIQKNDVNDVAFDYGIKNIPTFMFFDVGNKTQLDGTIVGIKTARESIEERIKIWTGKVNITEDF